MAFRKRVMGGGERIVSRKGFGSPDLLASEIVEQLLVRVITTDLLKQIRPEAAPPGQAALSKEEQAPAIAAAVERLAEDKDVDLLALAKNPQGLDPAELEAKLMAREKELEEEAGRTAKKRAEYWRHFGALAFLSDTQKALAAYEKATALDPDDPEGWRYLGELHYRLGDLDSARKAFTQLELTGAQTNDAKIQSMSRLRLYWIEKALGNLTKAEQLVQEALKIANAACWSEGMARAYGNLGNIYETQGDLIRAEEMQLKSLKLGEGLGNKEGMAISYGNLGNIYYRRGDLVRAEDMQLKARRLHEQLRSKEGIAATTTNLANIYNAQGDLVRARDMQFKALRLDEELGRKEGVAASYTNLALIPYTQGDFDGAEEMQLRALKLYSELAQKKGKP
jgi:tetratricopeptide (TPR) repeat protein